MALMSSKLENVVTVKLINRKDLTKITDNTTVSSNHVFLGWPYGQHPHPALFMRGYNSRENSSENMDIQHIINSWSVNKENDEDYIQTRKGGIKRKMPVADTPNRRNNCSIRRYVMPLTETQLRDNWHLTTLGRLLFQAIHLNRKKISNIQKA